MDPDQRVDPSSASVNGVYRLVPLSWSGEIVAILAGLIVSFFLFGYFSPYWRIADQDILLIYDALLQNEGLPREVVYHPAHLSVTALSGMFRLLHGVGILRADFIWRRCRRQATSPPTTAPGPRWCTSPGSCRSRLCSPI